MESLERFLVQRPESCQIYSNLSKATLFSKRVFAIEVWELRNLFKACLSKKLQVWNFFKREKKIVEKSPERFLAQSPESCQI